GVAVLLAVPLDHCHLTSSDDRTTPHLRGYQHIRGGGGFNGAASLDGTGIGRHYMAIWRALDTGTPGHLAHVTDQAWINIRLTAMLGNLVDSALQAAHWVILHKVRRHQQLPFPAIADAGWIAVAFFRRHRPAQQAVEYT